MSHPRSRLVVIALGSLVATTTTALGIASAVSGCSPTEIGIDCQVSGTTTTMLTSTVPPLRYLATTDDPGLGECWFWSRFPPGLDSWDPYNDPAILTTRWRLPECPDRPGSTKISVAGSAWAVFRSFVLPRPRVTLRPEVGITNLPTLLGVSRPTALSHAETLPDGRVLEVIADVGTVWIDWGDGTPPTGLPAPSAFTDGAAHPYTIKTCPQDYRLHNPSGWRCHPTLDAYPVTVTFSWVGRYRTGGSWIRLGTIDRPAAVEYDVDEVVGVLVAP